MYCSNLEKLIVEVFLSHLTPRVTALSNLSLSSLGEISLLVGIAFRCAATALAAAKQPLPVDPKLAQLRDVLAEASRPLPPDARLQRLRGDVDLSLKQLENSRLTFAQDLAWALINSPAFLFNH